MELYRMLKNCFRSTSKLLYSRHERKNADQPVREIDYELERRGVFNSSGSEERRFRNTFESTSDLLSSKAERDAAHLPTTEINNELERRGEL